MPKPYLKRLLKPRSIAVFGGGWAQNVVAQSLKMGFEGDVWPVHPKLETVAGLPAFANVKDLPSAPDASFIGVNRNITIDVVKALSDMGAGGAVCFAAGFREAGDHSLQDRLLEAAGDMPIIGPNCYGLISYLDGALLWPDQHGGLRVDQGVAIITQSSNIAINMTMAKRGLPIGFVGTVGNQAQIGFAELGLALLEDERITALGLHIEGMGDIRALESLATRAKELGKPIIAMKVGKSEQAQIATVSHTASLAGGDSGAQALLDRLGIRRVNSIAVFLETIKLLHYAGPLPTGDIISVSCSGGEASIMADTALQHPTLHFPEFSTSVAKALSEELGPIVSIANPFDYHTFIWNDLEAMTRTFTHVMRSQVSLVVFVVDFPRSDRCDDSDWKNLVDAIANARKETGKATAILASLPENISEDWIQHCGRLGIIPLCGLDEGLSAIAGSIQIETSNPAPLLLANGKTDSVLVDEETAKANLAKFGVPIPGKLRINKDADIHAACEQIGFPLVVKGLGLAHKTEAGAVKLNLQSARDVVDAIEQIEADEFLLEKFINEVRLELLIGVIKDPAHGFVLTIAAGGVMTEINADSRSCLLPASEQEIERLIDGLKIAALLRGYRGLPKIDTIPVVKAVAAICAYVEANSEEIIEVEVNPLLVRNRDCFAADALLKKAL